MRGDTKLRLPMHFFGAYLYLYNARRPRYHRGVKRLIAIWLGEGDIVLKFAWEWSVERVHDAERGVAILHCRHDETQSGDIVDEINIVVLPLQFLVQAPE